LAKILIPAGTKDIPVGHALCVVVSTFDAPFSLSSLPCIAHCWSRKIDLETGHLDDVESWK
jgi:hypothetical protein